VAFKTWDPAAKALVIVGVLGLAGTIITVVANDLTEVGGRPLPHIGPSAPGSVAAPSPASTQDTTSTPVDRVADTRLAEHIAFSNTDVPAGWIPTSLPGPGSQDGIGAAGCVAELGSAPPSSGQSSSTLLEKPLPEFSNQVSSYVEVLPTDTAAISLYALENGSLFLNCLRQANESVLKQRGLTVSSSKGDFLPSSSIGDERFTDQTTFAATSLGQTNNVIESLVIARKGRVVVLCAFISLDRSFPSALADKLLRTIDSRL
jgi:hypothetical protein